MQTLTEHKNINNNKPNDEGKKYFVNIEGIEHPWASSTISTEQIASLGGWAAEGVIEIDKDNVERNLVAGEIVDLKAGHGFAKKVHWKRGDNLFQNRLEEELQYLLGRFNGAKRNDIWFFIPDYPLPNGWNRTKTDIAFKIQPGYPATAPYGFYVPVGLKFKDQSPNNYQESVADRPMFDGEWGMFSWAPEEWRQTDKLSSGYNLLNFALGFAVRFQEGA